MSAAWDTVDGSFHEAVSSLPSLVGPLNINSQFPSLHFSPLTSHFNAGFIHNSLLSVLSFHDMQIQSPPLLLLSATC